MSHRINIVFLLFALAVITGCSHSGAPSVQGSGGLSFRIAASPQNNYGNEIERLQSFGPVTEESADVAWFLVDDLTVLVTDESHIARVTHLISETQSDAPQVAEDSYAAVSDYFTSTHGLVVSVFEGEPYLLLHTSSGNAMNESDLWELQSLHRDEDQLGRASILLRLDDRGADMMRAMTQPHIARMMVISHQEKIMMAATINATLSHSITITGDFTPTEIDHLIESIQNEQN